MSKHRAFTLAEVLITLSIIGVVAALIIPGLVRNFQDTANRTAFKKNYSDLSQAVLMLKNERGSLMGFNATTIHNALKEKLLYTKDCTLHGEVTGKCWHINEEDVKYYDGTDVGGRIVRGLVLKNGAFLGPLNVFSDCDSYCAIYWIDINGFKGPNIVGKDVYWMYIDNDKGLQPVGIAGKPYADDCGTGTTGIGCAQWVMEGRDY